VTPPIASPPTHGGEIRRWHILQGLKLAGEVDALVLGPARHERDGAFDGCGRVIDVEISGSERQRRRYGSTFGRGLLVLGSSLPLEYQPFASAGTALAGVLQGQIDLPSYDLVWLAGAHVGLPLARFGPRTTILDGGDFSYVRDAMLLRQSPWYGAKIWNHLDVVKLWWLERGLARRFDVVVRCSDDDRMRHPAPNVAVIPNGTTMPTTIAHDRRRRVLFVGDLGYAPNTDGVEWFLTAVWPLVRQQVPDAALDIVGRKAPPRIAIANGRDGVEIHGFLPDLEPVYRTASVSVVPLRAGSGTRLKILESLAREVPVVSTRVGAFGIAAGREHGVERADTPTAFAEACVKELLDAAPEVSRLSAGREFVRAKYDWAVIRQQVAELATRTASRSSKQ
jgi:glycosyltransferase involved in cell wall biosynthesis